MKSRWIGSMVLSLMTVSLPASAQVVPLGKLLPFGGVATTSCTACDAGTVVSSDCGCGPTCGPTCDSGTVWGTECIDCMPRRPLFPPCPNPCRTTLLGELVGDVKCAVDGGLSRVFGSLFGNCAMPCGCVDVCGCDAVIDSGCAGGCDATMSGEMMMPATMSAEPTPAPLQPQPTPATAAPLNPFQDEPGSSTLPTKAPSVQAKTTGRTAPPVNRRPATPTASRNHVQRTSFEQPTNDGFADSVPTTLDDQHVSARPLRAAVRSTSGHYQPRRMTTLRQSNGTVLKLAPVQTTVDDPTLRFRPEADESR